MLSVLVLFVLLASASAQTIRVDANQADLSIGAGRAGGLAIQIANEVVVISHGTAANASIHQISYNRVNTTMTNGVLNFTGAWKTLSSIGLNDLPASGSIQRQAAFDRMVASGGTLVVGHCADGLLTTFALDSTFTYQKCEDLGPSNNALRLPSDMLPWASQSSYLHHFGWNMAMPRDADHFFATTYRKNSGNRIGIAIYNLFTLDATKVRCSPSLWRTVTIRSSSAFDWSKASCKVQILPRFPSVATAAGFQNRVVLAASCYSSSTDGTFLYRHVTDFWSWPADQTGLQAAPAITAHRSVEFVSDNWNTGGFIVNEIYPTSFKCNFDAAGSARDFRGYICSSAWQAFESTSRNRDGLHLFTFENGVTGNLAGTSDVSRHLHFVSATFTQSSVGIIVPVNLVAPGPRSFATHGWAYTNANPNRVWGCATTDAFPSDPVTGETVTVSTMNNPCWSAPGGVAWPNNHAFVVGDDYIQNRVRYVHPTAERVLTLMVIMPSPSYNTMFLRVGKLINLAGANHFIPATYSGISRYLNTNAGMQYADDAATTFSDRDGDLVIPDSTQCAAGPSQDATEPGYLPNTRCTGPGQSTVVDSNERTLVDLSVHRPVRQMFVPYRSGLSMLYTRPVTCPTCSPGADVVAHVSRRFESWDLCAFHHAPVRTGSVSPGTALGSLYYLCDNGYDNFVEHYTLAGSTAASRLVIAKANRQVFRYVKSAAYGGAFTAAAADFNGGGTRGAAIVCGDAIGTGCSAFVGTVLLGLGGQVFIDPVGLSSAAVNIYVNGADSVKFDDYWLRIAGGVAASTYNGKGYIAFATYYQVSARPAISAARIADFCGATATLRYTCASPQMYAYIATGMSLRIKVYKSNAVDGTGFPGTLVDLNTGCLSSGGLTYGIFAHEAKIEIVANYMVVVFCRDAYRDTDPLLGFQGQCGYKTYEINDATYTPRGAECMYELVRTLYYLPIDGSRRVIPSALSCRLIDNGPTIRCAVFFAPAAKPLVFDPLSTSTAVNPGLSVSLGGNGAVGDLWDVGTVTASATIISPTTGVGVEPPTPYNLHSTETGFFWERMLSAEAHGFQLCTWEGQCWAPLHTYTGESGAGFMSIVPGVESGLMVVNRLYSRTATPTTATSLAYVVLSGQYPMPENWRVPLGLSSGLSWQSPSQTTPLSGTTKCAGGTYSINGQTCAVSCPAGRYRPGSGESLYCLRCPGGTFRTDVGWASCANVAVETSAVVYSGATTTGSACLSPTYAPNVVGTPKCQICPPGQFYNTATKACTVCAAGTASPSGSVGSCPDCAAGKFITTTGATACLDCPAGRAQPTTGQSVICSQVCQDGTFSGAGASTCSPCAAGTRSGTGPVSTCTQCTLGTFSLGGTSACANCVAGKYSDVVGASVCKDCAAGSASSDAARQTPCDLCGIGFYTATPGRTAPCDACGPGLTNFVAGSQSCTNCNYGEQIVNSVCIACDAGFVFINTTLLCGFCKKDFRTTAFNQTVCTQCGPGLVSVAGSTACDACDNGKYEDVTKYQDQDFGPTDTGRDGNGTCSFCPPNSQNTGEGNIICGQCLPGFGFSAGGCTPCQTGFYSNASVDACTACPSGFFSSLSGSSRCDFCLAGTFSPSPGSSGCVPCTPGSYCPFNATSTPILCPANTFTTTSGNIACQNCTRGTALSIAEAAQCGTCVPGQNQLGIGTPGSIEYRECVVCGNGVRTDSQGISVCQNCSAGFQQTVGLNLVCTLCPEGRFSSSSGSTVCRQCRAGWFQDLRGQTTEKPCARGRFTSTTGQSVCQFCATGSFASGFNSSTCTDCAAGSFASVIGSTQCTPCRLETFSDEPASGTCADCPRGTFGTTTGQTICKACGPGRYQNNEGSVGCVDCAAGTYSSTNGSAQCTPCSTYFFAATQASTECTECPVGYIGNADNTGCVLITGIDVTDDPFTKRTTKIIVGIVVGLVGVALAVTLWICHRCKKREEAKREASELQLPYQQVASVNNLPPSLPQPLNVPDYRTMSAQPQQQFTQ